MGSIHPTAIIHPSLELPADLELGPYTVLEADVVLGSGTRIGPFCHLYSGVRLEADVVLADGVILGNKPQDLKYRGEKTYVGVGAGTELREYVTVNRGTQVTGWTRIGAGCLIMAYSHVAHDCVIEDRAILANGVQMGGHVRIGAGAVVSGLTGIHQFTRIGPGAFVGGGLRVDKDVPPFSKAMGEPLVWAGVNAVGLAKLGFAGEENASRVKAFYRILFSEGSTAALAWLERRTDAPNAPEVRPLAETLEKFLAGAGRGVLAPREPRRVRDHAREA